MKGNKITKNYNERWVTKRRRNNELLKKTERINNHKNAIIHEVGENNKKYQLMSKKDKKMPKQKRKQHSKTKEKITKHTTKCNPFDCVHEMNDGTTSLKHNHTETME